METLVLHSTPAAAIDFRHGFFLAGLIYSRRLDLSAQAPNISFIRFVLVQQIYYIRLVIFDTIIALPAHFQHIMKIFYRADRLQ